MLDEKTCDMDSDLEDLTSYTVEDLKNWLDSECQSLVGRKYEKSSAYMLTRIEIYNILHVQFVYCNV